jgi:hypothetical protein
MLKKIIVTSQLLLLLSFYALSQSDSTLCIDFNTDLNHKIRKNIIGAHAYLYRGNNNSLPFELSYERILKKHNTIAFSFGGLPYFLGTFHCNVAYRSYISNIKYGKVSYRDSTYFIRKQPALMSAPKGLYVEAMGIFSLANSYYNPSYVGNRQIGLGVGMGYQFLFFNRLVLNPTVQLPLTFEYDYSYHARSYDFRPRIIFNISIGYAF